MRARSTLLVAFAVLLGGCIDDTLVHCGQLDCPAGDVCTPGGCAAPGDVTACEGLVDGAACRASNGGIGTCQGGACHTGLCGNGTVDVGEVCDDGNQISGDGCRADCKKIEVCGDGELDQGEACDDGNQNPADGCDACRTTAWIATTVVGSEIAATATALANPSAIAIDGVGRTFVVDTDNHRILRIELDGGITVVAGTGSPGFSGDGAVSTSAQLASPYGVAVDGLGRIFIADTENQRVRRVDLDGTITTIAGIGTPGYSGDGGLATFAELASPFAVAVDGLGGVLIADSGNHCIRRVAVDGMISTLAGDGTAGFTGDGGAAAGAELANPLAVAVDGLGRVLIADSGNVRIRRIELDGTIGTIAGTGDIGYLGDGGPATAAWLSLPIAVTVDALGQIVFADTGNQRVRRIALDGTIATVAGTGDPGFGGDGGNAIAAMLANPLGVAVDAHGEIAITDTSNQRVRRVASDGTIATIAGTGTLGFGGDGREASSAQLSNPFGIAIDTSGRIYIADTFDQRIRRVDTDGTITTIAGSGPAGFAGDGGPATVAQLHNPDYLFVDASGRVFISDTYNQRIRRIDSDGTIVTIAGTGIYGFSGDGGPATSAELAQPNGLVVDALGRVVFTDTYSHRVRRIDTDGTIHTIAGTGTFGDGGDGGAATDAQVAYPYGVAIDATGRIVIVDTGNHRVRRIELDGTIHTIAGTGMAGYNGDGQATAAQLSSPYAIAIDASDRIFITDAANQRIRRIDTDGTIATIAGTGTQGGNGDAGPALAADLAYPYGIAVDATGGVVISDTNNERVRRIAADGTISTVAGKIDPENIGPVAQARLEDPRAIVVAAGMSLVAGGASGTLEAIRNARVEVVAGRYPQSIPTGALARFRTDGFGTVGGVALDPATGLIYISESSANRIQVITQVDPVNPLTWTIATLANDAGTPGFADGAAAVARFRSPSGLFLDGHTLYIADTGNHAIRALDLTAHTVTTIVNTSHSLGFGGDGGPPAAALLYQPTAITRCSGGDLFIADTGNQRIRRVAGGAITTVLGDGIADSSGEGAPARSFPVDAPRGLACDPFGNLFVTSSTAVRLLPASDAGVVDGNGAVQTIYGAPPRDHFPASVTGCLTGLVVTGDNTIQITDACTGLVVQLARSP